MDIKKLSKIAHESVFIYGAYVLTISITYAVCKHFGWDNIFDGINSYTFVAYSLEFLMIVSIIKYFNPNSQ